MSEPARRESLGGVLGIALGLALFAAALAAVASTDTRKLAAPAEAWAERFPGAAPPAGYEVVEGARLPGDRVALRLRRADLPPAAEPAETDEPPADDATDDSTEEGSKSAKDGPPRVDWASAPVGPPGERPAELVLLFAPPSGSGALVATYFHDLPRGGMGELGPDGGTVVVESGELTWHGYVTSWVRQRRCEMHEGAPSFVETWRVNLTIGRACVLLAIWERGRPGSAEVLEELLAPLEPPRSAG